MTNDTEFNNNLEKIRENAIIEVNQCWGLSNPGCKGIILTNTKNLYIYQYYNNIPKELEDTNVNFISKKRDIEEHEFKKIINFIEKKIINKDFDFEMIFDAGFEVIVNYNGVTKEIKNNRKIYDKAKELMTSLLEK